MKQKHALLATMLVGCTYYEDRAVAPSRPATLVTVHGDTRSSPSERADVEEGAVEIRTLTNGNYVLRLVWDLDESTLDRLAKEPVLVRSTSLPPGYGGYVDGDVIKLMPERCPSLRACAMHEFGHFIGLQHVDRHDAVMAPVNPGTRWTSADYAECRRVKVCDRRRDVTTVTVTIDPSIPAVEPDYPVWSSTP